MEIQECEIGQCSKWGWNCATEAVVTQVQLLQTSQLTQDCATQIIYPEIQEIKIAECHNGGGNCATEAVVTQVQWHQTSGKHVDDGTNVSHQLVELEINILQILTFAEFSRDCTSELVVVKRDGSQIVQVAVL